MLALQYIRENKETLIEGLKKRGFDSPEVIDQIILLDHERRSKQTELDAQLVGASIARQIEGRISYRRAIKMAIAAAIRMNAEGIKIQISGRLNGAEMARAESYKEGRIPLSTFRADIDYALVEAHTTYGRLGIKVWIMKGEVYGKRELSPLVGMTKKTNNGAKNNNQRPQRRRK